MDQRNGGPDPAWAREHGFVELAPGGGQGRQDAADRLSILDTVARYQWCIDERDATTLASLFTEDCEWSGSVAGAIPIGPVRGRDAVVKSIQSQPAWSVHAQRRHCAINPMVTRWDDSTAEVISYLVLVSTGDTGTEVLATGFTRFTVVGQPDGRWLIDRYFLGLDALVSSGAASGGPANPGAR